MRSETEIPEENLDNDEIIVRFKKIRWLLDAKTTAWISSWHFWLIVVSLVIITYIYYEVLPEYHDIYIIMFFYPLLYASIIYRRIGVVIAGLVVIAVLLPYTFIPSYDPGTLARSTIFTLFIILISGLYATILNYLEHQIEAYDHILELNRELNASLQKLQTAQRQLIQVAKLGAIGELAASVAHELNNPLAGILVYTKLLEKKMKNESFNKDEALANLEEIESATNYCSDIIRGLLDFARQSTPVMRPITISRIIDKAISLAGHQAKNKKVEIIREEYPSLPLVTGDFNQILQVMVNLLVNAVQSMGEDGKLTISTGIDGEDCVKISFQDTGCGISAENLDRLFTPFFTTKQDVKGVGLGLAVSHGIIERHGGRIEVESRESEGSTFTIYLPSHK
jgi:signal transduction histidine kinase